MRLTSYFPQENEHSCGPAVVQMALAGFGIPVSQAQLERELETPHEPEKGTETTSILKIITKYGLMVHEIEPAHISDIQKALQSDDVVIICFTEPDWEWGHYALVREINESEIILCDPDPDHGPQFVLSLKEFEQRWRDDLFTKTTRWMAQISRDSSAGSL